ncbi:MAG: hypothetical protein RL398_1059 [Planctomycetota bacterium]
MPLLATFLRAAMLSGGCLASLSAQQTWTVNAAGGAQFVDIGAAVAAAASGDAIVVAAGAYAPFVVDGKSLVIVGTNVNVVTPGIGAGPVPPTIEIKNLGAGQMLRMAGIGITHFVPGPAALRVADCTGTVWVESAFVDAFGAPSIVVERCADVVLAECTAQTNRGTVTASGAPISLPGARLVDATVRIVGGEYRGSTGVLQGAAFPQLSAPPNGGDGLVAVDAQVRIASGRFLGGAGTSYWTGTCTIGGNGGDGVQTETLGGTPTLVRADGPFLQGGGGGNSTCGGTAVPGVWVNMLAGLFVLDPGYGRILRCAPTVTGPAALPIEVVGRPGDLAIVCVGLPVASGAVLGLPMSLSTSQPIVTLGTVSIGLFGRATLQVAIPALPPGLPDLQYAVQSLVLDAAGGPTATNPRTLLLR